MTSREAFAKFFMENQHKRFDPGINGSMREVWQAAIQHARDVAEDCIEHELGETGQAKAIVFAIKEALK